MFHADRAFSMSTPPVFRRVPAFDCWVASTSSFVSWRRRRGRRRPSRWRRWLGRYSILYISSGRISLGGRRIWSFDHFSTPLFVFWKASHEFYNNNFRARNQYTFPIRIFLGRQKNCLFVYLLSFQPSIFRKPEMPPFRLAGPLHWPSINESLIDKMQNHITILVPMKCGIPLGRKRGFASYA